MPDDQHKSDSEESETSIKGWGDAEKAHWLAEQRVQRSYQDDVVSRLQLLRDEFEVHQHGALSYAPEKYPLFIVRTRAWNATRPTVLITGGVHGYETSGVHGALRFLEEEAAGYAERFNIAVVPCVSPWGYETINRWNSLAIDPNRSFCADSPAEESAALMKVVAGLDTDLLMHMDLHETTDTDKTVFRPALAARDGVELNDWGIPDGFYLVGDTENPADDFQSAIIASVREVTHIAPPDENGCIIGKPITQEGVINYDTKGLFLCTGFSNSRYCTTTEVYPDSPSATPEECILAQVAAVKGGLKYLIRS